MHDDVPDRHTLGQPFAHNASRPVRAQLGFIELGDIEQAAVRHDFGQDHRHGLQRFNFFFVIEPRRAILHCQHAVHLSAADDRHAEKRAERILPRFRPIGEPRVARCFAEIDRFGRFRDETDKSLA